MIETKDIHLKSEVIFIPCSTIVKTICGNIVGMITAVVIRFEKVQYEITYESSGKFETTWMNEAEFKTMSEYEKIKIGFKRC